MVNGDILAESVFHNFQENLTVPVVLSESNHITNYDNETNQYFELISNSFEIYVKFLLSGNDI